MNKITKHNYEAYLLDYSEQLLSAEDVAELLLFIELNPELNVALDSLTLAYLDPTEENKFTEKEFLKKLPRIETLAIGAVEQILEEKEQKELFLLMQDFPAAKSIVESYSKTILPIEHIIFPNKQALKRTRTIPIFWPIAVAASLIGFIIFFGTDNESPNYQTGNISVAIEKYSIDESYNDFIAEYEFTPIDTLEKTNETSASNAITPKKDIADAIKANDTSLKDTPKELFKIDDVILPQDIDMADDVIDSIPEVHFENEVFEVDDANIAMQNTETKSIEAITVGQFLKGKAKEIILKENYNEGANVNNNDLLASVANGLNSKTKMDIAYTSTESDDKKITKFKFGKVEFYRSSSK